MGFNAEKFNNAEFEIPTRKIEVPQLADWFDKADEAFWTVKGLTAEESAITQEAQERNKSIGALMGAIVNATGKEQSDAIRSAVGLGDELPADVVRRIEILVQGSVDPICDRDTAIKLGTFFPTVFYRLSNNILELTGEGANVVGKHKRSTKQTTSK